MIELFVVRANGTFDLPVQSVEWSGQKLKAPRSLTATVVSTQRGLHQKQPVDVGDQILFRYKGAELFRGTIFNKERTYGGELSLTAYDDLFYLTQNTDRYLFTNKSLGEILKRICSDFQIPLGTVAETPHKMTRRFDGQPLFDIVMTAISLTYKHTGVKYYLYCDKGKLNLVKRADQAKKWVIEDGVNLVSYTFGQSAEEMATRIKLESGEDKKIIVAKIDNPTLQKRFGIIQHYEQVSEKLNKAQLLQRAQSMLKEKAKIQESFSLDALGIPDVISGSAVYVANAELGVRSAFYVDEDTHTFEGKDHQMSLTLTKTDELPEIDASSEIAADEKAKERTKKDSKSADEEWAEQLRKEIMG